MLTLLINANSKLLHLNIESLGMMLPEQKVNDVNNYQLMNLSIRVILIL